MRKVLLIAAATVGGVVILIAGLLIYAALNLNSIVKSDRQYVLGRISASVGRDVQAQDIQIGLGWGVTLEITGLQIADDPAFSQLPFLKARQMSGQVEVLALLSGQILITRLAMHNPDIRILRDRAGHLNISTLGPHGAAAKPERQAPARQPAGKVPIRFLVQDLSVRDGAVFYQEVPGS
ncbi:MAG TPA: AsmA family protein, partial [Candidatus Binataceae bacterium]|nr:AsmA family protein [Candidatus Binataceae bacterium]